MAVFVAASDETSGGNALSVYHYAGWVAPEPDWSQYFAPAWEERVLAGPPKIGYLHMTDMRSREWRALNGITDFDADERLNEAALVIDQMGSLYPVDLHIDGRLFKRFFDSHKVVSATGSKKKYQPDFLAFTAYAYAVLTRIHIKHPNAEKVDFLVENNSDITKYIHELYAEMPSALKRIGAAHLIPLLGEFLPAGKDRVPLQAADYLCWHSRRAEEGTLTDIRDLRRWNTISQRKGFASPISTEALTQLSEAFTKHGHKAIKTVKNKTRLSAGRG